MAPKAKPMAAKIPANLAMSNGAAGFFSAAASSGLAVRLVLALSAFVVISSNCLLSFSLALLVILSVTQLPNLR